MSRFECLGNASYDVWREIFALDPRASAFQSPEWMAAIVASGHYEDVSRLYRTEKGRILVPLALKSGRFGKSSVMSMPHGMGAGGPVADYPLRTRDIQSICTDLGASGHGRIAIRPNPVQSALWAGAGAAWSSVSRISHVLDLTGGYECVVRDKYSRQTRRHVNTARRSDMTMVRGNSADLVAQFYRLYLQWSAFRAKRRHLPVALIKILAKWREPRWKYDAMADGMGPNLQVYIATAHGEPVAGAIFLQMGKSAIYWRGASDPALWRDYRGNDLVQDCMIRDACAAGCTVYHMGESGGVESLMEFKARFGAAAVEYAELIYDRPAQKGAGITAPGQRETAGAGFDA